MKNLTSFHSLFFVSVTLIAILFITGCGKEESPIDNNNDDLSVDNDESPMLNDEEVANLIDEIASLKTEFAKEVEGSGGYAGSDPNTVFHFKNQYFNNEDYSDIFRINGVPVEVAPYGDNTFVFSLCDKKFMALSELEPFAIMALEIDGINTLGKLEQVKIYIAINNGAKDFNSGETVYGFSRYYYDMYVDPNFINLARSFLGTTKKEYETITDKDEAYDCN